MEAKDVDLNFLNRTIERMGYGTGPIYEEESFQELGMDSYAVLDLILEVETCCNTVIPDDRIMQMVVLGDILKALHEKDD